MQQKSVCARLSICYSSANEHVQRIAIDVHSKQGTTTFFEPSLQLRHLPVQDAGGLQISTKSATHERPTF